MKGGARSVGYPGGRLYISKDPMVASVLPYILRETILGGVKQTMRVRTLCRFSSLKDLKDWAKIRYNIDTWIEEEAVARKGKDKRS